MYYHTCAHAIASKQNLCTYNHTLYTQVYYVTTQNGLLSPLHWSPVALYDVQVMSSTMVCCHHLPPMRLHPNTTSEAWKLKPSSLGPLDMTSVYRQVLTDCMVYGYARGQTITIEATAATTTTTITTAKATDNNNYNHDHNPFATTPRRTNPPTDQHKTPLETMCNDPMNSNYRNRFCLHTSSQEFMSAAIADCI